MTWVFTEQQIRSSTEIDFWQDPMRREIVHARYVAPDGIYRFHIVRLIDGCYRTIHACQITNLHPAPQENSGQQLVLEKDLLKLLNSSHGLGA